MLIVGSSMATIGRATGFIRAGDRVADIHRVQARHGADVAGLDLLGPLLGRGPRTRTTGPPSAGSAALPVDHRHRLGLGDLAREDLADGDAPDVVGVLQRVVTSICKGLSGSAFGRRARVE